MPNVEIKIEGLEQLQKQFLRHPVIMKERMGQAMKASIFEIQKRTDDSGDSKLFQFKTPRAKRTGYLARSFAFGITFGELYASIGPTAAYAEKVYSNNPYLDRIGKASQEDIDKHFADALENIVQDIAKK